MFSPAHSPDWSATEPSWGSAWSVFVSVIHAMSPDANTSGWPSIARSGPTGTRLPRCELEPSDCTIGFACIPAPHTSVCAFSSLPDFSVTRVGAISETGLAAPSPRRRASRAPSSCSCGCRS